MPEFSIRPATVGDAASLMQLIRELAAYEKLDHTLCCTEKQLAEYLFGDNPAAWSLIAEAEGKAVGYAVVFQTFSTFLGRPGFWLEDIYVTPEQRGKGIGKGLLQAVARKAAEAGVQRIEWTVLDWNQPAIDFYEGIGATVMPDWRVCRLAGEAIGEFAAPKPAERNP